MKKKMLITAFVLLILSIIFVSPTLTGNTIGVSKKVSDIIAIFFLYSLGITLSMLIKKE